MSHRRRSFRFLFLVILVTAVVWGAIAQQPKRIDDAALKDAGKTGEDWISYNVNWSEQRYSPLNQINASNVGRLGLAWATDIPAAPGPAQNRQGATHRVDNGVLYSITSWREDDAVDAKTGKE